MIRNGTGRAKSQPTTRIGFRPMRSDTRAAIRLTTAFVTPKLTINDVTAVLELSPNSCSPRSGSTVRSRPTIAPTKAFRKTRSENCGRFSRSPSRISLKYGPRSGGRRIHPASATRSGTSSMPSLSRNAAGIPRWSAGSPGAALFRRLSHVAPLRQAANLGLHWVEELADLLLTIRFQHEVGDLPGRGTAAWRLLSRDP